MENLEFLILSQQLDSNSDLWVDLSNHNHRPQHANWFLKRNFYWGVDLLASRPQTGKLVGFWSLVSYTKLPQMMVPYSLVYYIVPRPYFMKAKLWLFRFWLLTELRLTGSLWTSPPSSASSWRSGSTRPSTKRSTQSSGNRTWYTDSRLSVPHWPSCL